MCRVIVTVLVLGLAASACADAEPPISMAPTPVSACDLLAPLWGDAACGPLSRDECLAVDWTGAAESIPSNPSCFGFFEDISNCPSCNILSIPDYTLCKNRQYIDCLMAGHLSSRAGKMCFVTPFDRISLTGQVRITARELCYYQQRTGGLPRACPQECAASRSSSPGAPAFPF